MARNRKSNSALEDNGDAEYLRLLRSGPIEEFAAHMGGDLNLAVQLRIDEAVSDAYDKITARQGPIAEGIYNKWAQEMGMGDSGMHNMDIAVRPIEPMGNLHGFASVKIGGVRIDGFKIVENKDGGLFVGMPSKPDKTSATGYRNTVYVDEDVYEKLTGAVIAEYHAAVENPEHAKTQQANRKPAPEKPRAFDQVKAAQKEAERHNATLPKKEKGAKAKEAGRE